MAPKTDVIEQLRERVRELEEENARLHERVEIALSHEINRLRRLSDKVKPPVEED